MLQSVSIFVLKSVYQWPCRMSPDGTLSRFCRPLGPDPTSESDQLTPPSPRMSCRGGGRRHTRKLEVHKTFGHINKWVLLEICLKSCTLTSQRYSRPSVSQLSTQTWQQNTQLEVPFGCNVNDWRQKCLYYIIYNIRIYSYNATLHIVCGQANRLQWARPAFKLSVKGWIQWCLSTTVWDKLRWNSSCGVKTTPQAAAATERIASIKSPNSSSGWSDVKTRQTEACGLSDDAVSLYNCKSLINCTVDVNYMANKHRWPSFPFHV